MTTTTTWSAGALAFLATYWVHSSVLLGAAWVLGRFVARGEAWRETLWKSALVGGLATALIVQISPWTPPRLALPGVGSGAGALASGPAAGATGSQATTPAQTSDGGSVAPAVVGTGPVSSSERAAAEAADAAPTGEAPVGTVGGVGEPEAREAPATAAGGATPTGPAFPRRLSWPEAFLFGWAFVAAGLLLRLALRHVQLGRALAGRRPVTEGHLAETLAELRRQAGVWEPVRLTTTAAISSPMLLGRGDICVPERFVTELGPEEQRAALAHELGHLARRDRTWLLCATLLECVFFFQPLHRVARRRLRESAEFLADSWAVRLAGGRLSLARCLAEVASWVAPGEPRTAPTVAMAEGGSPLLERVRRLIEREPEVEPRGALRASAGLVLIALAAGFAPVVVGGAGAAPSPGVDRLAADPAAEEQGGLEASPRVAGDAERTASPAERSLAEQAFAVIRAPAEGDLTARLAWARQQAGGSGPYWVAWAVPSVLPATTHVSQDSGRGMTIHVTDEVAPRLRSMDGGVRAMDLLGVNAELRHGTDGYDVLLFAIVDPALAGGGGQGLDRLAVRSPAMPIRISGPTYWLGRVDPAESFQWHLRAFRAGADRRLSEQLVKAAALHAAPGVEPFLRAVASDRDAGRDLREPAVEGLAWHPSDESVDFLVAVAREDADLEIRTEAAETLGELDHPAAGPALEGLVRDADPRVREEALESLAERPQDATVIQTLVDVALNDRDPDMRAAAVELLGERSASQALPALRRVLAESDDDEVLMEVAETLGDMGGPEALAALDEILARDLGDGLAAEAVEAIADGFAPELARPRLEAVMRSHPSREVRHDAADELMEILGAGSGGGATLVEMALRDPDPELRKDAVQHIGELPADEAVPLLQRVVLEAGNSDVEQEAAEALGDLGTPEALAALDEIVEANRDEALSMEALEAIADNFSRDLAIPRLRRIIADHPSTRLRREALDLLADLGGGR